MDPRLRLCRAGPSLFLFVLIATAINLRATVPIGGQASKSMRFSTAIAPESANAAEVDTRVEAEPKRSLDEAGRPAPVEEVARPGSEPAVPSENPPKAGEEPLATAVADEPKSEESAIEPEVSPGEPEATVTAEINDEPASVALIEEEAGHGQTRTPQAVRGSKSYLPVGGALPLRFVAVRRWPAPIPNDDAEEEDESKARKPGSVRHRRSLSELESAYETTWRDGSDSETLDTTESSTEAPKAASESPVMQASSARVTSEMVLNYMNNLEETDTNLRARFLPAVPGERIAAGSGFSAHP